jgi:hypothetical protein
MPIARLPLQLAVIATPVPTANAQSKALPLCFSGGSSISAPPEPYRLNSFETSDSTPEGGTMKRGIAFAVILLTLAIGSRAVEAASSPVINVNTLGIELCPQSICGAAIFTGLLQGQVGGNDHALGTFAAALTHDPLPDPGNPADLTGGVFEFRIGLRRIRGVVLPGGTLFNNGNNTFAVDATLFITSGGSGTLHFQGILNHNTFPPTIIGTASQ